MIRLGCLAALAFTSTAATATSAVNEMERAALDDAIRKWDQLEASDYTFDFQNLCNCLPGATAKMRIEVVDAAIKSVTYAEAVTELHQDRHDRDKFHEIPVADKGSDVPNEFAKTLVPIGPFLREMKRSIARPLAEFVAEYDAETGVPCHVYFNFSGPVVDDELEIVLSNFGLLISEKGKLESLGCSVGKSEFVHFSAPQSPDAPVDQ